MADLAEEPIDIGEERQEPVLRKIPRMTGIPNQVLAQSNPRSCHNNQENEAVGRGAMSPDSSIHLHEDLVEMSYRRCPRGQDGHFLSLTIETKRL